MLLTGSGEIVLNKVFVILCFLFSFNSIAENVEGISSDAKVLESFSGKKLLIESLTNLNKLSIEKYPTELDSIYEKAKNYISFKEKQCRGEFSSLVIDENGREILKKIRLNKKEKKVCLLTLIKFRILVTKSLFEYRQKYLIYTHKKQVVQLEQLKEKRLLKLNVMANKLK